MTNQITLGNVTLDEFVSQSASSPREIEKLDKLIDSLGGIEATKAYKCEKLLVPALCQQRADLAYSQLDLSFLSMCNKVQINVRNKTLKTTLPKFGVIPVFGYPAMNVTFDLIPFSDKYFQAQFLWINDCAKYATNEREVDVRFGVHLVKTLEFAQYSTPEIIIDGYGEPITKLKDLEKETYYMGFSFSDPPKKLLEKYEDLTKNDDGKKSDYGLLKILGKYNFNQLLPDETKDKIEDAQRFFRKEELYIIPAIEPDEWNCSSFLQRSTDPLVVGLKGAKCYLIDVFGTTSIEDYVRKEFTTNPKDE